MPNLKLMKTSKHAHLDWLMPLLYDALVFEDRSAISQLLFHAVASDLPPPSLSLVDELLTSSER